MTENNSKGKYWLLFLISAVAFVLCLMLLPEAFWLTLPTMVGGFAMAMDWI